MNAPLSFRERRALQLHADINRDEEREVDPFDRDDDPTERADVIDLNQRRETWTPAVVPVLQGRTPAADAARAAAMAVIGPLLARKHDKTRSDAAPPAVKTCWRETPQKYRAHIVQLAGLPAAVVNKADRDLTEAEKAKLRAAIATFREEVERAEQCARALAVSL